MTYSPVVVAILTAEGPPFTGFDFVHRGFITFTGCITFGGVAGCPPPPALSHAAVSDTRPACPRRSPRYRSSPASRSRRRSRGTGAPGRPRRRVAPQAPRATRNRGPADYRQVARAWS